MFIPDLESRRSIALRLGLEYNEKMQDWEYEVSSIERIPEFIFEYDKSRITGKEKETLMEIILDSLNDLLIYKKEKEFESYFPEIVKRLKLNVDLHRDTIDYWTKNNFKISIFIIKSLEN